MTPWASSLLDDANELIAAGRHSAALGCVLTVLSVHPDLETALRLVSSLAYADTRTQVAQPLTDRDIRDPRLDSLYCSCQAAGCTYAWVSVWRFRDNVVVRNARAGHCDRCDAYFCRHHFGLHGGCPQCGRDLDYTTRLSNGRPAMQTIRLNQPLVHVHVMREGTGRISPEYMTELVSTVAPDVLEDSPTLRGTTAHPWPDDSSGRALAQVVHDRRELTDETHDMYVFDGCDQAGVRWVLVKVSPGHRSTWIRTTLRHDELVHSPGTSTTLAAANDSGSRAGASRRSDRPRFVTD